MTKHADVEVSGQMVKTRLIKHGLNSRKQRTMGHKLSSVPRFSGEISMWQNVTSQIVIQRFKLKMSRAAIILLDKLQEDGKRENR